jgi:hypothetical protein
MRIHPRVWHLHKMNERSFLFYSDLKSCQEWTDDLA